MADTNSGGGTNVVALVALLIFAVLVVLFFIYGLPMLQKVSSPQMPSSIKLEIPTPTQPAPAPTPAPQQ